MNTALLIVLIVVALLILGGAAYVLRNRRAVEPAPAPDATLDGIYFSPYHPETQYADGLKEYRRASDCRKPGIGMIMQVLDEHGIDLASTCFIGDTWRDIRAGQNAGLRSYLVHADAAPGVTPDGIFPTTLDAARELTPSLVAS